MLVIVIADRARGCNARRVFKPLIYFRNYHSVALLRYYNHIALPMTTSRATRYGQRLCAHRS
jgi:hypothetical protein